MHKTPLLRIALIIGVLSLLGCGRISDSATDDGSAQQRISASFGSEQIVDSEPIVDGQSVVDALRETTPVETAFGGGFVVEMHDRASDADGQKDWFVIVNGVSPGVGAADITVRPGDHIWWDYRRWGGVPQITAVVGSWPQPFISGYPSAPTSVQADPPLDGVLVEKGVNVTDAPSTWRVRVGSNADLREREPAWKRASDDPAKSGLPAAIVNDRIVVLDESGTTLTPVDDARAIAVAVLSGASAEKGGVVLVVVGLDEQAAEAAAQRIADDPSVLEGRYAVAFDEEGAPVAAAGRATP